MITIQYITSMGAVEHLTASQIQFVRICPHCDIQFLTIDPDQIYPNASHRELAYRQRQILRSLTVPPTF